VSTDQITPNEPAAELAVASDDRVRWIEVLGDRIRVAERGEGEPVLYLHGLGDRGSVLPGMTMLDGVLVIRPDHPGFLWSEGEPASIADIVATHLALVDALGIRRLRVVGCSFGGWIAAELALAAPQVVESLTLIDPAGLVGEAPDVFALAPEVALELTVASPSVRAATRPPTPAESEALARSRATAQRIVGSTGMHDPTLAQRLGELRGDVELIWGADDGIIPVASADAWVAAVPTIRLHVLPGVGHVPPLESPAAFAAATALGGGSWS
jgi:pimeloyl-ACP methyl ester carboxylesterase